jgi:DNA repair protein RecN (Recombination protein N)
MLRQLRIENLVLAREVLLEFAPGLNLVTGETGGGKSLMVNALALATGARGDSAMVRQGTERALIEAVFDLRDRKDVAEAVARAGYDAADGELMVRREIGADGRSRAFLGGSTVTLALLRELTSQLVELHGQHEPQTLLQPELHRELIDRFGGHDDLCEEVRRQAATLNEITVRLADLAERRAAREGRLDLLRFRLGEFEQVRPEAGEEDELRAQRERLRHAESIGEAVSGALDMIYEGEDAAVDRVHAASRRLRAQAAHDDAFDDLADRLDDVRALLGDLAEELRSNLDDVEPDPERLASIEERLHALERLRRRFEGAPLSDIVATAEAMRREAEELEGQGESVEKLEAESEKHLASYRDAAAKLGAARREAGDRLAGAVNGLLRDLAMARAALEVEIESVEPGEIDRAAAGVHGVDRLELMLRANPGEPARPLRKIASGGELSRLMLAIDVALEGGLPRRTLLFDEVDQGLGGEAADRLGEFLARVAGHHQVVCVTHLPQVAARADVHVTVAKKVKGGRTVAVVKTLEDRQDRVDELARMLGGSFVTDTARSHAEALLDAEGRAPGGAKRGKGASR